MDTPVTSANGNDVLVSKIDSSTGSAEQKVYVVTSCVPFLNRLCICKSYSKTLAHHNQPIWLQSNIHSESHISVKVSHDGNCLEENLLFSHLGFRL